MRRRAGEAAGQAERADDRAEEVVGERHLGALLEQLRRELDPRVRVDPSPTRFGDRLGAVDRQAGCVGEQVA